VSGLTVEIISKSGDHRLQSSSKVLLKVKAGNYTLPRKELGIRLKQDDLKNNTYGSRTQSIGLEGDFIHCKV
jgi:hypothetical protein